MLAAGYLAQAAAVGPRVDRGRPGCYHVFFEERRGCCACVSVHADLDR